MLYHINPGPVLSAPRVLGRRQLLADLFTYLKYQKFIPACITFQILDKHCGKHTKDFYKQEAKIHRLENTSLLLRFILLKAAPLLIVRFFVESVFSRILRLLLFIFLFAFQVLNGVGWWSLALFIRGKMHETLRTGPGHALLPSPAQK